MSDNRDEVSAKIGSLLLKGYKMLADGCPTCYNVLMQDKKGVTICVNCNRDNGQQQVSNSNSSMEIDAGNNSGQKVQERNKGQPKAVKYAIEVLLSKIDTAADLLRASPVPLNSNVDQIKEHQGLVQNIRLYADAIKSLQEIRM